MAEFTVDRGEVGVERLRIAFAERGGKLFGMDSAFAELLQTRVEDSPQKASEARADQRSTTSQTAPLDVAPSRTERKPREGDETEDDSQEKERARPVRSEGSSRTSGDDSAAGQVVSSEVKQPGEDAEAVSDAPDPGLLDRDEQSTTNDVSRPPAAPHAVENMLRRVSQGENGPRAGASSPKQDSEHAAVVETEGDGFKGRASAEVGAATEIAAMVASDVRQPAGGPRNSPDRRKLKGEGADQAPTNRHDPAAEGKHRDAPVTDSPGVKEGTRFAANVEAGRDSVSTLGTKGMERGTTEEGLTAERSRGRGKRQVQKGDVKSEDGANRLPSAGGMQNVQQGIADKSATPQNFAPVPGENPGPPVAAALATAAPAAAALESNAATSAALVIAGTESTRTDSGATASETQATAPGRSGEGARTNIDAADRARFVQRVSQAFRAANERGGHVRLRLHPPELGSLRVELKVADGVMSARMEAESTAARDLLAEHLPLLRQRLADHGIRVERFELDLMGQSGQDASQQTFQPPSDGQGRRHHEMGPSRRRAPAVEPPGRAEGIAVGVRTANGIDVII